jgi:hypothetical protein
LPNTVFNSTEGNYITNIPYNDFSSTKYLKNSGGFDQQALNAIISGSNRIFGLSNIGIKSIASLSALCVGTKTKNKLNIKYAYYSDTLTNGYPNYNSPIIYDEFNGTKIK